MVTVDRAIYLVWPCIVAVLGAPALKKLCVGLMCAALVCRGALTFVWPEPIAVYVSTFTRIDTLAAGALLALWAREPGGLTLRVGGARVAAAFAATLMLAEVAIRALPWNIDAYAETIGYSVRVVFFSALVLLAVEARPSGRMRRVTEAGWLKTLGRYSYALYLFHSPIQSAFRDTALGVASLGTRTGSEFLGQLLFYPLATAAAVPFAMASWFMFERPILSLKRYFTSSRGAPASVTIQ